MNTLPLLLLSVVAQPATPPSPCDHGAAVVSGDKSYAPCGAQGVGVFAPGPDGAPALQRMIPMDAQVVGVHIAAGRVWAELLVRRAQPIDGAKTQAEPVPPPVVAPTPPAPPPPPAEPAPAPPPEPPAQGRIVEVGSGHVFIDLGEEAGLKRGDRVELYLEHPVDVGGGATATEEERLAVGVVTAATKERARVRLGRNERVADTALARPTEAKRTGSTYAPPRVDGVDEFGFTVRPFLALDALGFGTLSQLRAARRWANGFTLHAAVEPLGLGFADTGDLTSIDAHMVASFDTRLFELGFGAGYATITQDVVEVRPGEREIEKEEDSYGLSVRQLGRLGARDGVNLEVKNTFLLYDGAFQYGGTVGKLVWPLTERSALFGRGGGAVTGFGFGELGLRLLAVGNGDRGSILIDATIGGAALFGAEVDYGGPMIGFGMEWRR